MPRFARIIVILLLAMWLPATMHCGLESLFSETHLAGNLCDDKQACDHDACDLLEHGGYMGESVVEAQPALLTPIFLPGDFIVGVLWTPEPPPEVVEKPPLEFDIRARADWRFSRRVALLPGAPHLRVG